MTRTNSSAEEEQPVLRERLGEEALRAVDEERAEHRPEQRAAPAHRDPDRDLDRVGRRHLAGVDDAHLRHVQRAGHAAHHRRQRPDEELVPQRVVAGEASRVSASRIACSTRPSLRVTSQRASTKVPNSANAVTANSARLGLRLGDAEAEDRLEVGEAVVAAEAGLVAEEQQHERRTSAPG